MKHTHTIKLTRTHVRRSVPATYTKKFLNNTMPSKRKATKDASEEGCAFLLPSGEPCGRDRVEGDRCGYHKNCKPTDLPPLKEGLCKGITQRGRRCSYMEWNCKYHDEDGKLKPRNKKKHKPKKPKKKKPEAEAGPVSAPAPAPAPALDSAPAPAIKCVCKNAKHHWERVLVSALFGWNNNWTTGKYDEIMKKENDSMSKYLKHCYTTNIKDPDDSNSGGHQDMQRSIQPLHGLNLLSQRGLCG